MSHLWLEHPTLKANDLGQRIGVDDIVSASMSATDHRGQAWAKYLLSRANHENAMLVSSPSIAREGDVTQDMVYRLGLIAGLMIAASVPEVAQDHVQKMRDKERQG